MLAEVDGVPDTDGDGEEDGDGEVLAAGAALLLHAASPSSAQPITPTNDRVETVTWF
jgi:hypothetical protein